MSNGRILVVDDDSDIGNLLNVYFESQGYAVDVAVRGAAALTIAKKTPPDVVVLDINLPDMSGYDVFKELRNDPRTRNVPIVFLTQKSDRDDRINSLKLGAEHYVSKPFDIEELKLLIQNSLRLISNAKQIDPISNLPVADAIEGHLRELMQKQREWVYLDIKIAQFDPFAEVYGWTAGNEVVRFVAQLLRTAVDEHGTEDDYIGRTGQDRFVLISHVKNEQKLIDSLVEQFDKSIQQHYSFIDRDRGYMLLPDEDGNKPVDLMTLQTGMVTNRNRHFSDIREVIEQAALNRRHVNGSEDETDADDTILTSW